MGRCFGSRYYDDASMYEKRKRDMGYPDDQDYGKAKREDISIV
jgi:hypothetical protein